ncbi:MAG: MBL fold metallo-hydrolase [Gammaproteobacteria bacterium]
MTFRALASTLCLLITLPYLAPAWSDEKDCKPGDYAPSEVMMVPRQVSEHVWYLMGAPGIATDNEGFISNAAFVITDEGVVVFDALGTPSLANKLLSIIREKTDQPIKKLVVSHYHADHIYGIQVFKEQGAEVIAPFESNTYLESDSAASRLEERQFSLDPWVNECTRLIPPDRALRGDYAFSLGGIDFKINHLGSAHSTGDLTLFVEQDRVLMSGDVIFEGRVPFVGDADTKRWLQVLIQMETAGISALIPGHGPAASAPNEAIRNTRRYLAFLRLRMKHAAEELIPFEEAYEEIDWSEYEDLPAFEAANRRNAYHVYLTMEAEAVQ